MSLPVEELTPREIVAALDRHIVGQASAKKAVAVALRNRYRRQQLPPAEREEILPKNILMIGPTGVGKTEIARRLAQLACAPFIKVEATKFTEVGYVGRDVESMVRDLAAAAVRLVERERIEAARPLAEKTALELLIDLLDKGPSRRKKRAGAPQRDIVEPNPLLSKAMEIFGSDSDFEPNWEAAETKDKRRKRIRAEILEGKRDEETVEIEVEEASSPFVQVFTPQGMEEMGLDMGGMMGSFRGDKRSRLRVTVAEARDILTESEARKHIDSAGVSRDAIVRAEQTGIIFLDEIDKIAMKRGGAGPDVSREGVQRDLLPIIEGSTVATKFGPVRTDHILFIAAGAFHESKPSDLIPELQGRLPIRVELETLGENDFGRILREPQNAITKQYQKLLEVEGVALSFTEEALDEIARLTAEVNARTENIGARRLHTLMERLLEEYMFEAPDSADKSIVIDGEIVRDRLAGLASDTDLSRYIL